MFRCVRQGTLSLAFRLLVCLTQLKKGKLQKVGMWYKDSALQVTRLWYVITTKHAIIHELMPS